MGSGLAIRSSAFVMVLATTLLAAALLAACGGSGTGSGAPAPVSSMDAARVGAQLYDRACAACHGSQGRGGSSGVPLNGTTRADQQLVISAIRDGVGRMPASSGGMSREQIQLLAEYVASLR